VDLNETATTDANGEFWFTWLTPGLTYTVKEVPPAGSVQTTTDPPPMFITSGREWVATEAQGEFVQRAVSFPWEWQMELQPFDPSGDPSGEPVTLDLSGIAELGFSNLVDMQTGEVVPIVDDQDGLPLAIPEGRDFLIQTEIVSMELSGQDPFNEGGTLTLSGTGQGQGVVRNEGGALTGGFDSDFVVDSFFDITYEIEFEDPSGAVIMTLAPVEPLRTGMNFEPEDEIPPTDVRWMPTFLWETGLAQDLVDEAGNLWDQVIAIHTAPDVEREKPIRPVVEPSLEFGNTFLGSIHGYKFEDLNVNGIDDDLDGEGIGDEPRLAGVEITLTGDIDGDGDLDTLTEFTNDDGEYWFEGLHPGVYTVTETSPFGSIATTPASFVVTVQSREELVALPGQAHLPLGDPRVEVPPRDANNDGFTDLVFGNAFEGSIHGFKFEDLNGDGIRQANEPPLPGVTIELGAVSMTGVDPVGSTVTDQNGEYWFQWLEPGVTYVVTEVAPAGSVQTTPDPAPIFIGSGEEYVARSGQALNSPMVRPDFRDDGYLEFINPTEHPGLIGTVVPTSPPGRIMTEEYTGYTLADGTGIIEVGDSDTTAGDRADFDWVQENRADELAGLGNHPGQVGALGWTVGTPETSPHIDPGTGLPHGHSDEETPPGPLPHLDNAAYTRPLFAAVDVFSNISTGQDSDTDANGVFSPREAALDYVVDFVNSTTGVFSPGVMQHVWVPGWTLATTIDDYVARWVPRTPGLYDFIAIEPASGAFDDQVTEIDAVKALPTLKPIREVPLPELEFGNTFLGSIHGYKFEDVNGNGIDDDVDGDGRGDEPRLAGVTITLTGDADGDGLTDTRTEITDANGEYWFVGLHPGRYTVGETPPAGSVPTTVPWYSVTINSREELVALPGQAQLPDSEAFPDGDPRVEVVVGDRNDDGVPDLAFGNRFLEQPTEIEVDAPIVDGAVNGDIYGVQPLRVTTLVTESGIPLTTSLDDMGQGVWFTAIHTGTGEVFQTPGVQVDESSVYEGFFDVFLPAGAYRLSAGVWQVDMAGQPTGTAVATSPFTPIEIHEIGTRTVDLRMEQDGIPDDFLLQRVGDAYQLSKLGVSPGDGASFSFSVHSTTAITVLGGGDDDRLIVDFAGGNPIPVNGVHFDGGSGSTDELELRGGSALSVEHEFHDASSGAVRAAIGGQLSTITYTGLEPITDSLVAVDRVFTFGPAADAITLDDGPVTDDGRALIDSPNSELVDFAVPSRRIIVNAGAGDDFVQVTGLDGLFTGSLILQGAAGDDFVDASLSPIAVRVLGGMGDDELIGSEGDDQLIGGGGNDVISGADGDDRILGNSGSDELSGGAGDDQLRGHNGDDQLAGGDGDDRIKGNGGVDTLDEAFSGRLALINPRVLEGDSGTDRISSIELFNISGSAGDDELDFSVASVPVRIDGGAGNDTIRGGDAADNLLGGDDDDVIAGGAGPDLIEAGDGDDLVNGGAGVDTINGRDGNDSLSGGIHTDYIFGHIGNDVIVGHDGSDRLFGGGGNDIVLGRQGKDKVYGNNGRDTIAGGSGFGPDAGDLVIDPQGTRDINEAFMFPGGDPAWITML
ncbi:MAG: SdrD B-like domain-containing protein, partial [Planctomycetota bacterium]